MNRHKMKYWHILWLAALLCSCNNNWEKEDIIGAWESDEEHYVIHLYDNDSCVITDIPKNTLYNVIYREPWRCREKVDDTTRVEVSGKWYFNDNEEVFFSERHSLYLGVSRIVFQMWFTKGFFFWRKEKWKLFYITTDDYEIETEHTFSRCKK